MGLSCDHKSLSCDWFVHCLLFVISRCAAGPCMNDVLHCTPPLPYRTCAENKVGNIKYGSDDRMTVLYCCKSPDYRNHYCSTTSYSSSPGRNPVLLLLLSMYGDRGASVRHLPARERDRVVVLFCSKSQTAHGPVLFEVDEGGGREGRRES